MQAWDELASRWPDDLPMPTGAAFEAWLGQVARMRQAQALIAKDGPIVADARGNPIPHPALAIEKAAQAEIRTWGDQFTPDRQRRVRR